MIQPKVFRIVDQQKHFIVACKSAQQNFHDEGEIGSGLFSLIKQAFPLNEVYPIHRLDKMTSGLIIFAISLEAAQAFQQLFEQQKIEKFYLAISDQKPKKKQGLIKGDMKKSRRSSWKLLHSQKDPAITQFFSYGLGKGFRLFLLKPRTGKTHQIRVALSSIGSPILGDPIYNPKGECDRGYLHALAIRFQLFGEDFVYFLPPEQGELFLTDDVKGQLLAIGNPWELPWPVLQPHAISRTSSIAVQDGIKDL